MENTGTGSFMAFFTGECPYEDATRVIVSAHPNSAGDPDMPAVCVKIAQGTLYLTRDDAVRMLDDVAALLTKLDAAAPQRVAA